MPPRRPAWLAPVDGLECAWGASPCGKLASTMTDSMAFTHPLGWFADSRAAPRGLGARVDWCTPARGGDNWRRERRLSAASDKAGYRVRESMGPASRTEEREWVCPSPAGAPLVWSVGSIIAVLAQRESWEGRTAWRTSEEPCWPQVLFCWARVSFRLTHRRRQRFEFPTTTGSSSRRTARRSFTWPIRRGGCFT